jgi:hypothetical protein
VKYGVGTNWSEVVGIQTTCNSPGTLGTSRTEFAGRVTTGFSLDAHSWIQWLVFIWNFNPDQLTTNGAKPPPTGVARSGLSHSLGYGQYTWFVIHPGDQSDTNTIAGCLTYEDDYREIDIEFTTAFIPSGNYLRKPTLIIRCNPAADHQTSKMHRRPTNDLTTHGFI